MDNMDEKDSIQHKNEEMFAAGKAFADLAKDLLEDINRQEIKLFDLPAHKRIFLFILTRAIKTFAAIEVLCRNGYGQDVAALVRSLMESLITAQYIVHKPEMADDLARRFVEYKWILFRRSLAEEELAVREAQETKRIEFMEKKNLVLRHVDEFRKKYNVISDKGLLTWSGKTLKDMARDVSKELMREYESTFRQCSRFSHPTILGDSEYIIQDDKTLTFSPAPATVGIEINYRSALHFYVELLTMVERLFSLNRSDKISELRTQFKKILSREVAEPLHGKRPQSSSSPLREVKVFFRLHN